jgi:transporter family protein
MLRGMSWLYWALLSALFAAGTALLAKVGVENIDSNLATAIRTSVVLVFTWGIALALERHHGIAEISRRSWLFLVLSGICTGLSWLCYFRALQLGPASSVAPIDKLSVVLVMAGAWAFLGEHLTPLKLLGGSLITLGAIVLAFA